MLLSRAIVFAITTLPAVHGAGETSDLPTISAFEVPGISTQDSVVRIERIPAKAVLIRTISGPYSKHVEAFTEFMRYAEANFRTVGACFGIYPTDPDAIKGDPTWRIGVEVAVGPAGHVDASDRGRLSPGATIARLPKPKAAGYELRELEAVEAAVMRSTVARSGSDGLKMIKWLADNGYAQTGPTRMEYLSHTGRPEAIPTRIVVPVASRKRPIRPAQ